MVPHAGLAPAPLRDSGAHPPADRRRWLCDKVSGLYATTQWGCAAGMWLELGGIKHGHAHTGYMIAAGCCAGPSAAKEETWKAVLPFHGIRIAHLFGFLGPSFQEAEICSHQPDKFSIPASCRPVRYMALDRRTVERMRPVPKYQPHQVEAFLSRVQCTGCFNGFVHSIQFALIGWRQLTHCGKGRRITVSSLSSRQAGRVWGD